VAKHLGVNEGLIYLPGQQLRALEDSDMPVPFRQRRYFYYLTGVEFENCIVTYDISGDYLQLYIPPVDAQQVIWLGSTPSIEECEEEYDVDAVCLTNNVGRYLEEWLRKSERPTIYLLHKFQAPHTLISGSADINFTALKPAMDSARVIKSDFEIRLIRRANDISSRAHRTVLEELSWMANETAIEGTFLASCVVEGAKKQAYNIIAASGENASTLHYDANNQPLKGRQLVCLDAGCEWNCYASDITRTFPISGIYTKEAKEIYSIVQKMQETCISLIKPGKMFREIHLTAMRIAVEGLMRLGILCNGTFEEVLPTGVAFFPHGVSDG
jgi:Xaa-Pro dipeptidase